MSVYKIYIDGNFCGAFKDKDSAYDLFYSVDETCTEDHYWQRKELRDANGNVLMDDFILPPDVEPFSCVDCLCGCYDYLNDEQFRKRVSRCREEFLEYQKAIYLSR